MKWSILNQPLGSGCPAGSPTRKEWIWAIPAAISAATSIFGAASSASANNEAEAKLEAEKNATESERRRKKYQSWTDTASGQNTMRMLRDMADREYKRSSGAAAVGGKTEASVAAEKELQNQKQAEVIANAVAAHEDQKDQVDASYRQQISGLNQQLIGIDQAKGQAVAQAASGISNAMMQVAAGMTGNGSPAGGGVNPAMGGAKSTLQQMGTDLTPDISRQIAMQHFLGYNKNYSALSNNPDFQRMMFELGR